MGPTLWTGKTGKEPQFHNVLLLLEVTREFLGSHAWLMVAKPHSVWRDSGGLVKLLVEGSSPDWNESLVIGEV